MDFRIVVPSGIVFDFNNMLGAGRLQPQEVEQALVQQGAAADEAVCELRRSGFTAAVTDRDAIIAITGSGKRELLGKPLSDALAQVMEQRSIYQYQGSGRPLPVSDSSDRYTVAVAAPILCEGDVLGLVLFLSSDAQIPGEGEYKLAQTVSAFLGRHMET